MIEQPIKTVILVDPLNGRVKVSQHKLHSIIIVNLLERAEAYVDRHPDVSLILLHMPSDELPDPVEGVSRKRGALCGIELLHGSAEAKDTYLTQVLYIVTRTAHASFDHKACEAAVHSILDEAHVVLDER